MKQFSWRKIREYRRAADLGQKELADRVGVMVQQISAWERNGPDKSLTTAHLIRIADALGKKTDDFFVENPEVLPGTTESGPSRIDPTGPDREPGCRRAIGDAA